MSCEQDEAKTNFLAFDADFMQIAISEAKIALNKAEVPIGAVIVKDGQVISQAHNQREQQQNPIAHAEIIAIEAAAQKLKNWRLSGCTIYVTLEPCPMCAGAIQQARISRLVYGTPDPKAGAAGSVFNIVNEPKLAHRLQITSGVEQEKCRQLLHLFFKKVR